MCVYRVLFITVCDILISGVIGFSFYDTSFCPNSYSLPAFKVPEENGQTTNLLNFAKEKYLQN